MSFFNYKRLWRALSFFFHLQKNRINPECFFCYESFLRALSGFYVRKNLRSPECLFLVAKNLGRSECLFFIDKRISEAESHFLFAEDSGNKNPEYFFSYERVSVYLSVFLVRKESRRP